MKSYGYTLDGIFKAGTVGLCIGILIGAAMMIILVGIQS